MIHIKNYHSGYFIFILLVFASCKNFEKNKLIRINDEDGSYMEGEVIKDSIFHGVVKHFDNENNNIGYSNFKYGLKNGPSLAYFKSGIISDSVNYINGLENGFGYKYDSTGRLNFKSFYYHGMPIGHVFNYDEYGNVKEYHFNNFEKKRIYSIKILSDSTFQENGEEINASIYSRYEHGKLEYVVFLYLLNPPFYKNYYEIAVFNKNKKVIFSNRIETNQCFYEQVIEELPNGNSYGIVMHKFNSYKQKDDLVIRLIQ